MTFDQALDHYKTGTAIAEVLGLSKGRVSQFKSDGGFPYPEQCVLEVDSKGLLKAKRIHDPSTQKAA